MSKFREQLATVTPPYDWDDDLTLDGTEESEEWVAAGNHDLDLLEPDADDLSDDDLQAIILDAEESFSGNYDSQLSDALRHYADSGDLLGLYIKEAGQTPLLTSAEELELGLKVEYARELQASLSELAARLGEQSEAYFDALSEVQEKLEDARQARDKLVTANLRLVISVAKRYRGHGLPFMDLIQEGNLGLLRAIEKFKPKLGNRFSTYATWWIRQKVVRALINQSRTIRVPLHLNEKIRQVYEVNERFTQEHGRLPTPDELEQEMGLSSLEVQRLLGAIKIQPGSLNDLVGDDEDTERGDFIFDPDALTLEEIAVNNALSEVIETILLEIESHPDKNVRRLAVIVRMRKGLLPDVHGKTFTLEEVAERLSITRERVRQLEATAYEWVLRIGMKHGLPAYVDGTSSGNTGINVRKQRKSK